MLGSRAFVNLIFPESNGLWIFECIKTVLTAYKRVEGKKLFPRSFRAGRKLKCVTDNWKLPTSMCEWEWFLPCEYMRLEYSHTTTFLFSDFSFRFGSSRYHAWMCVCVCSCNSCEPFNLFLVKLFAFHFKLLEFFPSLVGSWFVVEKEFFSYAARIQNMK